MAIERFICPSRSPIRETSSTSMGCTVSLSMVSSGSSFCSKNRRFASEPDRLSEVTSSCRPSACDRPCSTMEAAAPLASAIIVSHSDSAGAMTSASSCCITCLIRSSCTGNSASARASSAPTCASTSATRASRRVKASLMRFCALAVAMASSLSRRRSEVMRAFSACLTAD